MKKKILLFMLITVMTVVTTGCGKRSTTNNEAEKSISMYVGGSIFSTSLDPIKGAMSYGYSFTNCALLRVNSDSEYEGDLAEDWIISEDGIAYTFNLRKDVKFQDGSDFTAEDVVFTYETVKNNQADNENVDLTKLKSVEAVDDYTVKFTLNQAYSPFLDLTAKLGIVPSDNYDSEKFNEYPIGTGPWKITQYNTDQQIIVEANENYYEGKPEIEKVTFVNMDDKSAFSNAKSGQLDIVMVGPSYTSEQIDGMSLINFDTMDVRNISLPCRPEETVTDKAGKQVKIGNNVTSDAAVRKALSIGIDRQKIIKDALNGIGKPAEAFIDKVRWGGVVSYKDNQKDEAKKLLQEAGWTDGNNDGIREKNGIKCEFTVYAAANDQQRYLLASAASEEAKELGIKINVKQTSWDEIYANCNANGVVWGWGQYSPIVLQNLLYSKVFLDGGTKNTVGYSNEKVDELIDKALNSNNQDYAIKCWQEAQKISGDEYPYLYIVNIEHSYFISNSIDISKNTQIPHPHGHGSPIICNMKDWKIK